MQTSPGQEAPEPQRKRRNIKSQQRGMKQLHHHRPSSSWMIHLLSEELQHTCSCGFTVIAGTEKDFLFYFNHSHQARADISSQHLKYGIRFKNLQKEPALLSHSLLLPIGLDSECYTR
ncbi:unnamed protein product [Pleuronectes platessa]|uniref:Uncharacterized protein n=1 Tax=Pleuronectes platessa TaxID=8262 RepID=A0A9N7TLG4_PLEPL|nr:unnamed protein product [Pleuronectes platessa]